MTKYRSNTKAKHTGETFSLGTYLLKSVPSQRLQISHFLFGLVTTSNKKVTKTIKCTFCIFYGSVFKNHLCLLLVYSRGFHI